MRALAFLVASALPLQAQTTDPLPNFDLDSAITCLALAVAEVEGDTDGTIAADRADWIVFFSSLIAAKSTKADADAVGARFAEELLFLRNPSFEEGVPATPEEADDILTGTGKMCWFQALAAEGGPFADQ
jgi:hypothetical protein